VSDTELLAAVLAHPDDDAARLVYADWLEERGHVARAQVIHLQCELARTDPRDRRARELGWELDHVLAELDGRWRAELPQLDGVEWLALERGFAASVRVADVATLLRHGDAIATVAPVSRVELDSVEPAPAFDADDLAVMLPWLRALAASTTEMHPLLELPDALELDGTVEWLDRVRPLARLVVRASYGIGRELAERAARAAWAKQLVALRLGTHRFDANQGYGEDPRLGADGGRALAKLARLEELDIDHQRVGGDALGDLVAKLPALRELSARDCATTDLERFAKAAGASLVALDLSENSLGLSEMKALARAPRAAELRELVLDTCELTSTAIGVLVQAPCWQTLRALDLSRNPIGPYGARTLADASRPPHLHTLAVADADLDEASNAILAKAEWLDQLAVVDASDNAFRDSPAFVRALSPDALRVLRIAAVGMRRADASALARLWPQLVELDASRNPLQDAGLERFAATREARALQRLSLAECALGDLALELLGEHARMPRLRALTLSQNELSVDGLARFLASPLARQLVELALHSCTFVEPAARAIAAAAALPRLRVLDLRGNNFGEAGLVALADAEWLRGVPTLRLTGTPWQYSPKARERLAARFGVTWYQQRG
jgi:uncharacterized protein (TIGR02996 family)